MAFLKLAIMAIALGGVCADSFEDGDDLEEQFEMAMEEPPPAAPESPAPAGTGLNQLETARLTQAAQRGEFGVEGDASAFRFAFADPVCVRNTYVHVLYRAGTMHGHMTRTRSLQLFEFMLQLQL